VDNADTRRVNVGTDYTASNERMMENDELEGIWKEAVVA
jgi:hypothetical protein